MAFYQKTVTPDKISNPSIAGSHTTASIFAEVSSNPGLCRIAFAQGTTFSECGRVVSTVSTCLCLLNTNRRMILLSPSNHHHQGILILPCTTPTACGSLDPRSRSNHSSLVVSGTGVVDLLPLSYNPCRLCLFSPSNLYLK